MMSTQTTKTNHYFRALTILAALALAASLLATLVKPAEAAFPGKNGNVVFQSSRDGEEEIYAKTWKLGVVVQLTDNSAVDTAPAVSPDGTKIAFASDRDGNYEIYVMNADGTEQTRLTDNPAIDANPAFSLNGEIAFQSDRDGDIDQDGNSAPEIYVMDAVPEDPNTNSPQNLTNDPEGDFDPVFSPSGTKIAFVSDRDGNNEIYKMNANGANPKNLTNDPAQDTVPDWSPDGNMIAFESTRDSTPQALNWEVYVMSATDGNSPRNLTNNAASGFRAYDSKPSWSPDGKKIAFETYRDGNYEIYTMNVGGTKQKNLTKHGSSDLEPNWGVRQ